MMSRAGSPKSEVRSDPGPVETAAGILSQLLMFTRQLAASQSDPAIQIPALSRALGRRTEELKKVLPQALRAASSKPAGRNEAADEKRRIHEMISELHAQAASTVDLFQNAKTRTLDELGRLSRVNRAIRAYSA
jgi:hypothetical protein